jgi:hypothetical protein
MHCFVGRLPVPGVMHHFCCSLHGKQCMPVRICQPNQSSHLTVGSFGVPKKLFDLVGSVWHLHEMILVEPTNVSLVEMIGDCQNSLLFEL